MHKTMQDAVTTIAEGEFINAEFDAVVSKVVNRKTKDGVAFQACILSSGALSIDCTTFDHNFHEWDGQVVRFSGKGMKRRNDYNGKVSMSLGKGTVLSVGSGAAPARGSLAPTGQGSTLSQSQVHTPEATLSNTSPKDAVAKLEGEYQLCIGAAARLQYPGYEDGTMALPIETIQAAAATLFIEGNKRGIFSR